MLRSFHKSLLRDCCQLVAVIAFGIYSFQQGAAKSATSPLPTRQQTLDRKIASQEEHVREAEHSTKIVDIGCLPTSNAGMATGARLVPTGNAAGAGSAATGVNGVSGAPGSSATGAPGINGVAGVSGINGVAGVSASTTAGNSGVMGASAATASAINGSTKPGKISTRASLLQITARECGALGKVSAKNESTGDSLLIIQREKKVTTHYFPLNAGENKIRIEWTGTKGHHGQTWLTVNRSEEL